MLFRRAALHITRRIFHRSALDCSAPFVSLLHCCLRLYKMHINSCGEFHSATSCPESKRSLVEPMRAVWLSASFYGLPDAPHFASGGHKRRLARIHPQDTVPVFYRRVGRTRASAFIVWCLLLVSFIITRCGTFALSGQSVLTRNFF